MSLAPRTPAGAGMHLPALDLARGAAILMVYLYHCLDVTYGIAQLPWNGFWHSFEVPRTFLVLLPLTYGSAGVAVLFVVSGFCIHLSHARSAEPGFRIFFIRRFFRIYPPYLCALLLFAFVPPWQAIHLSWSGMADLLAHVTLLHNFDLRTFWGINPVFWSVAVEAQLYALYPILLWLAKRWGWRAALWTCGTFEVAHRAVYFGIDLAGGNPLHAQLVGSPLSYWLSWAFGAWLAECHLRGDRLPFATLPLVPWLVAAFASAFYQPTTAFTFLLFALVSAILLARMIGGDPATPGRRWLQPLSRHLTFAGLVSYSLYLFHYPLIELIPKLIGERIPSGTIRQILIFTLCLAAWPVMLGVAYLGYRWIEQTSVRIGKAWQRHHLPRGTRGVVLSQS